MKIQVRKGIWETNSSSTHSLSFASQNDYDKWQSGEMYYDYHTGDLVKKTDLTEKTRAERGNKKYLHPYEYRFISYSEFFDYGMFDYDTFEESYTTVSGDEIVAFGHYGYGG